MVGGTISSLPLGNPTPVPPSWEVQVLGSQTRGLEGGEGKGREGVGSAIRANLLRGGPLFPFGPLLSYLALWERAETKEKESEGDEGLKNAFFWDSHTIL